MRFISISIILILMLIVLLLWPATERGSNFVKTCQFVAQRIYLEDRVIEPWIDKCLQKAQGSRLRSPQQNLRELRDLLGELRVSHLDIYEPREVEQTWTEKRKTTGLVTEFVEGELIVVDVVPKSPAEILKIKVGDRVVSINGEAPNMSSAETTVGRYVLERDGRNREVEMKTADLEISQKWSVSKISERTAWLRIPSFRGEYFDDEQLKDLGRQLLPYRKIILDLRKNEGGNFVAGLRLLSMFFCGPQELGYLIRPRFSNLPISTMPNDLDDSKQLTVLDNNSILNLSTYANYPCLTQSSVVLIDYGTSSTSEMVAQSLRDYRGVKIYGSQSAGQLLVGVWYPWPILGEGVKISIPEAYYQTKRGLRIEENGVRVDENLFYRRADYVSGAESWVRQILQKF